VQGNQVIFTASSSGYEDFTVTATINGDDSWLGSVTGSGFNNDTFEAQPSFFP
jgi:hypothetical protein